MAFLIRLLGALPLRFLHAVGGLLGVLMFFAHKKTRTRTRANLAQATPALPHAPSAIQVSRAMGEGVMELPWLWQRDDATVAARIDIDKVSAEVVATPGATIFLAPHMGSFEVAAQYIAAQRTLTAMYTPPNLRSLDPIMRAGREKGQCVTAPADLSGIKMMLKALRRGESVGILPDQAPSGGEGIWAEFYGKPAYTMTLVAKLAATTHARLVMVLALRANRGRYTLTFYPLPPLPDDPLAAARTLNRYVEDAIAHCPVQYLWAYNRYKQPGGAPPPPISTDLAA